MIERRPLGATGLEVTRLGLGLAALGRPGYIDLGREEDLGDERSRHAMRERAFAVLDAAYAEGIRYVDAARSYGDAEAFAAAWLDARPHGDVVVGSKWGYTYTADWRVDANVHEVKDHSLDTLHRQLGESRAILGERLRLYQIHSATLESGVLDDRAVLEELHRLREEHGLAIGLTVSGAAQGETIRRALDVNVGGSNPFATVQATWNALERSAGAALAEAHAAGWGVLVKEAMANGRLGPRGDAAEPLEPLAREHGVGVDAIALGLALAQPWCDVVLSGAVTPAQLGSNAAATRLELDPGVLDALVEEPRDYWERRAALTWS
jgi:aryl-alcohol dehydrogenase-like predicted oxidoreductase